MTERETRTYVVTLRRWYEYRLRVGAHTEDQAEELAQEEFAAEPAGFEPVDGAVECIRVELDE